MLNFRTSYRGASDAKLMRLITKGDEQAFSVLYDRYGEKMHRYFYRMLWQEQQKAEDFTQELFLKIINKPHLYDPDRNFSSWLFQVAANMVKNEYRRHSRQPEITSEFPLDLSQQEHSFFECSDRKYFKKELDAALNRLSDEHRQCFVLRYLEEKSIKEISEILDCPEGTVKSRIYYALRKLAKSLHLFKPESY
ncbi:MAG: RNA polymerase sigma factor [Saprospiraceae bacterium]|nr:RNA polymerase sigma factor [Saprospiraceae bacterium]